MITIEKLTYNPFQENTYILHDETKECVIIDPGCYEAHEKTAISDFITTKGLKPVRLINTHCHIDHIYGNKYISEKYNLGLEIHKEDLVVLNSQLEVCKMYGIPNVEQSPQPSNYFDEGDKITFGNSELSIIFCPGHAPGHVVFVDEKQEFIIGGDVLFYGSIGRTDLPGGDHETLIKSIKTKLFPLPDNYKVYAGHGPETTIGFERANNPFLQ